ncbi:SPOR domain-containing protein [Lacinutrix neustonica]|uniref:SPOR domain-containing protein n=1 Tax=Lacinutrix neustonica TaxID=2980107 RepID=A0A9E8MX93_9FLAO|nr:SPOR domain-containing protein [Lacinutrix neustonica]WAC02686.1 SPOR domain-containing protein [Lacinutrix neustonica]
MPFIDEKDLVAMHEQIDQSKQELKQFEKNFYRERSKTETLKDQRNIFIGLSSVFLLLLLIGVTTYFASPAILINESALQDDGFKMYETVKIDSLETQLNGYGEGDNTLLASNDFSEEDSRASIEDELVYAVQVGAFEERMVSTYSESFMNLKEFEEDEFYKYSIGNFDNLNEAQRFRKELLRIGFRDAFIASYENGRRIRIEEAW